MLRLNKQNVPAGATLRVVLTLLEKEIRRNDGRDTTVPSRRFPVVDRHTTSSRKDKVSFLFVTTVSDVSCEPALLYYVCCSSIGQIFPSFFLSLLFFFSLGDPRFLPDLLPIFWQVASMQRSQTRFLSCGLCFVRRLSLLRCNNAHSCMMYINSTEADIVRIVR